MNDVLLEKLRSLKCFLLDMDGTIYLGPNPIPGAPEFLTFLRESGRRYLFFTNNPTRDAAAYVKKLQGMGIDACPEDVLTSGEATVRFLRTETTSRRLFTVAPPFFEEELRRAGYELVQKDPDTVILSFDTTLTYEKLDKATRFLRAGLPYYATNPDRVCPTADGYMPDCGAIAALLEAATGRLPQYVGKPNPAMARMGMDKLGAVPETTAMVGDRLYTDMRMAHDTGITSLLVLSGETTPGDLAEADPKPDFVFPSVRELLGALRGDA